MGWYNCRVEFSDPVAVRHALSIISEIAAKDPYSVAMALGQFPHILLIIAHTVHWPNICHYVKLLLVPHALKTANTKKWTETVETPVLIFFLSITLFIDYIINFILCHLCGWLISCMTSFYAGKSAQPGGMLLFSFLN